MAQQHQIIKTAETLHSSKDLIACKVYDVS